MKDKIIDFLIGIVVLAIMVIGISKFFKIDFFIDLLNSGVELVMNGGKAPDSPETEICINTYDISDVNKVPFDGKDINYILYWDYPSKLSEERKEVFSLLNSIDGVSITDKRIINRGSSYYYGSINESGNPEGLGVYLTDNGNGVYFPNYAGYFEDGSINGYGIRFEVGKGIIEEGIFDYDIHLNGEGITYYTDNNIDIVEKGSDYIVASLIRFEPGTVVTNYPVIRPSVEYEGNFDTYYELSGKGNWYWNNYQYNEIDESYHRMNESCYGPLYYKGDFIYSTPNNKGTAYYLNGEIMYKGGFEEGSLKGDGKAYSKEGHLIIKGEFDGSIVRDSKISDRGLKDILATASEGGWDGYSDTMDFYNLLLSLNSWG